MRMKKHPLGEYNCYVCGKYIDYRAAHNSGRCDSCIYLPSHIGGPYIRPLRPNDEPRRRYRDIAEAAVTLCDLNSAAALRYVNSLRSDTLTGVVDLFLQVGSEYPSVRKEIPTLWDAPAVAAIAQVITDNPRALAALNDKCADLVADALADEFTDEP